MSKSDKKYAIPGEPNQNLRGTGKPKVDWVKAWHHWFFGIDAKDNPSYGPSDYGDRTIDYNQGRYPPQFASADGKVYFLAGAAGTAFTTRSIIPADTWQSILVPVYTMSACHEEFPSLNDVELKQLVTDDVNGATTRKATLDGDDITSEIQQIEIFESFPVPLPDENILNLDVTLPNMITKGYWLFLDPEQVGLGEHILYVLGKSKNYVTETTYNLTIRGKKP